MNPSDLINVLKQQSQTAFLIIVGPRALGWRYPKCAGLSSMNPKQEMPYRLACSWILRRHFSQTEAPSSQETLACVGLT